MYSHVKSIEVFLWGRHVGTIAPKSGLHYRFEYDADFLRSGIEIAPFEMPSGDTRRQWSNCHALSVNGKQSDITDEDLLAVAARYGIGTAPKVLADIKRVFSCGKVP